MASEAWSGHGFLKWLVVPKLLLRRARSRIITSLLAHGRHIARHLEHEEHSGNHYLANALGLIVLGSVFRNSGVGQGWLCRGQQIMNTEIPRQFYADGVNYEGSVAYHGLALEMALLAEVALRRSEQSLCAVSLDRMERALDVTLAVSRSDGSYPPIGDVDDGHILPLGPRPPRSHLHLLALGGALFKRPDLAHAGRNGQADILWLLGEDKSLGDVPGSTRDSRAFPQGGVYVLQDDAHHLTIDCGNVGSLGRGGHGHADALSFDCFALGQPLIVDGGTFSYSGDPAARRRYRSVAQHNTLAVDDRETPRPVDLWSFEPSSDPRLLLWETTVDTDVFGGSYELSGLGVTHERWIVFDRRQGRWLVDDRILGSGIHHLVLRFHVPSINVNLEHGGALVNYPGEVGLVVQRVEGDWARPRVDACKISLMYRQEVNASAIVLEGSAQLMARCLTALVPYEGQCPDRDSILEWARSRELPYGADHPESRRTKEQLRG